ncbi:MAG: hypothetical protein B9J98_03480 [Candidatus Terraquivivens tikiterensis]|uniref:Uncharacterized protein n=1 Tax=Candidatus Terraquivivens tikiterensis TaxID=1980982 RepID=A0A2R7Y608_9ARCH|nr:MAG: hypothetical protein B9J98_03480 [Candidatus Terraquivivens tikiterensis]
MSSHEGVVVELTGEGIYLRCGDRRVGPYKTYNEINVKEVAEKLDTEPVEVFKAKQRARFAAANPDRAPPNSDVATEVADTFTYAGDRPFYGKIQVIALGSPQSRYMRLTFRCANAKEECPPCSLVPYLQLNFNELDKDPSAFATYFDTNNPRDALRILVERGLEPGCPAWWKSVECKCEDERAVTPAIMIDRLGNEGKAWFVHSQRCDLKRCPNWIIGEGWLCKGKNGRIGVLIEEFTPESEVASPLPDEVEVAKAYIRKLVNEDGLKNSGVWKVAEALKRKSQLKGSEVVKGFASDLLTVASPVWVKTPEGPAELGATTCELGPSTTAKSKRVRMLIDWLGCGKYDTGRKTPAGLTAGAEKVEGMGWIVRKGLLPSMDLSFLVLDNMPPHAIDEQIESRRNGIVSITAIRSLELWARCRLKLLNNPAQPFDEMLYRCTALKMFDSKLIARFTFAVFTYGVSTEERYTDEIIDPKPEDDELLKHARTILRWNLSRETTYEVRRELWPIIMRYGKELELRYGCEDVPLLLRAIPYKLACLAYSFALLEGYDEPEERHVRLAYEWLDFCAKDIQLDGYAEWWRSQHELSDVEYEACKARIEQEIQADMREHGGGMEETVFFKMIEYIAKNEKGQRDEIAAYANVDPDTITRKARVLKGLGLLRSDKDGYRFTAKGVRFFKRWLQELPSIAHVGHAATLRGQGGIWDECPAPQGGLSPKSADIADMSDRKPQVLEG